MSKVYIERQHLKRQQLQFFFLIIPHILPLPAGLPSLAEYLTADIRNDKVHPRIQHIYVQRESGLSYGRLHRWEVQRWVIKVDHRVSPSLL